jgi:hypothetical protein
VSEEYVSDKWFLTEGKQGLKLAYKTPLLYGSKEL